MATHNLSRIVDANGDNWDIKAKGLESQVTIATTGDVTGSATTDLTGNVSIGQTIANNAVTTSKIADSQITTAKIADSNVTLDKLAASVYSGAVSDNDGKLSTHAAVKSAIETAISGQGAYRGRQTVATINTWTATNLNNGDRVICDGDGTITLGNLPVRDGESLIFWKSGNIAVWQTMNGEFKLQQTPVSDPSASGTTLTAIATISQNANGDITVTKKTIQDATTGQKGVMKVGTGLAASSGTVSVSYGTTAGTACQGNDSRLSDSRTPKSHTHGNITNDGKLQTNDVTIASGDKLIVTDSSDSAKIARTSISFDGSTTTQALTKKGTWESFAKSSDITNAINALDVNAIGGTGKYITTISETDGKISATADDLLNTVASGAYGPVTSAAVYTALQEFNGKVSAKEITEGSVIDAALGYLGYNEQHHYFQDYIPSDVPTGVTHGYVVTTGVLVEMDSVARQDLYTNSGTNLVHYFRYINDSGETTSWVSVYEGDVASTYSSTDTKPINGVGVAAAIGTLDVASVGGNGKYISAISETDGKISATVTTMDTTPTASSTKAITSGGIKTYVDAKSFLCATTINSSNDLNTYYGSTANVVKYYKWAGGSTPTNAPSSNTSSVMKVMFITESSGSYSRQDVWTVGKVHYWRASSAGTWSSWTQQYEGSITSSYSSTGTDAVNGTAIAAALDTLDAQVTSTDGTNVQVKVTETDGKVSEVNITTDNTENKGNKVTSWSATTTDVHYPSEKLVKTALDGKKNVQTAKSDPTASGTGITYIATISQNTNGEITATKSTVRTATTSQTGVVQLSSSSSSSDESKAATPKGVWAAINTLDVTDTAEPNKFVTAVSETNGKISVTRGQPVMADVSGLVDALAGKEGTFTINYDATNNALVFSKTFGTV